MRTSSSSGRPPQGWKGAWEQQKNTNNPDSSAPEYHRLPPSHRHQHVPPFHIRPHHHSSPCWPGRWRCNGALLRWPEKAADWRRRPGQNQAPGDLSHPASALCRLQIWKKWKTWKKFKKICLKKDGRSYHNPQHEKQSTFHEAKARKSYKKLYNLQKSSKILKMWKFCGICGIWKICLWRFRPIRSHCTHASELHATSAENACPSAQLSLEVAREAM